VEIILAMCLVARDLIRLFIKMHVVLQIAQAKHVGQTTVAAALAKQELVQRGLAKMVNVCALQTV
jgi:hypothetical protein